MNVGTKSLVFGVHNIFWHPLTVLLAWIWLYRHLPSWRELVCIIIHDWGYWGKPNMDGPEGEGHPEFAAKLAGRWLDNKSKSAYWEYYALCLFHSRHYSRILDHEPSKLCWADKASIKFDPWWLYLPRAMLSGELKEYRRVSIVTGFMQPDCSNRYWYNWIRARQLKIAIAQRGDVVDYNQSEEFLRNVKK